MEAALVRLVRERAGDRCEYCRTPQAFERTPFQVDHVIARKHGGPTSPDNLCLSCFYCNSFKGSDIATLSPGSRRLVALYNPRTQNWPRHFRWRGARLQGRTDTARATIILLRINDPLRIELRSALIAEGIDFD